MSHLGEINSEQEYYEYGVDPSSSGEGVFMRATPKERWKRELKSYFAAVVLFDQVTPQIICESKSITGVHLKKSDLNVDKKKQTLSCKNNAREI